MLTEREEKLVRQIAECADATAKTAVIGFLLEVLGNAEPKPEPWTPKPGDRVIVNFEGESFETTVLEFCEASSVATVRPVSPNRGIELFNKIFLSPAPKPAEPEPWTPMPDEMVNVHFSHGTTTARVLFYDPETQETKIEVPTGGFAWYARSALSPLPKPAEPTDTELLDAIDLNKWDVEFDHTDKTYGVWDADLGVWIANHSQKLSIRDALKLAMKRKQENA